MRVRTIRNIGAAMACALVAGGALASPAGAATLLGVGDSFHYLAGAGEANRVVAVIDQGDLVLTDTGAAKLNRLLPAGCAAEAADVGVAVRCTTRGDVQLRLALGDGDDWFEGWELPRRVSTQVSMGNGENVAWTGAGDDVVVGGADRDTLYGDAGDDHVIGGGGNDYVRGNGGSDTLSGGAGLNFILGDGGDDTVFGGAEFEFIDGGGGDDTIHAGGGNDDIGAGRGDDVVFAGGGDDELRGGPGADRLFGDAGDDLLRTRDGERDELHCGSGNDVARVDADEVDHAYRSCERVREADSAFTIPDDVNEIGD